MSRSANDAMGPLARYIPAVYLLSMFLIVFPPLDPVFSMQRWAFGDAGWRFGFVGLVSGTLLLPLLGLLFISLAAAASRNAAVNLVVSAVSMLAAIALLGMMLAFGLDAIQLRRSLVPQALWRLDGAVIKTAIMQVAQLVGFLVLARCAWRTAREQRSAAARAPELVTELAGH